MRTVSGRRNRTVLILGGLLLLLAAAWIASASTPLPEAWPTGDPFLPRGDSHPADIAAAHRGWLLPAALAASILVAVGGIILLLSQIPTAPSRGMLRVTDQEGQLLGSIAPGVLERALTEVVEDTSGVTDASIHLGGSAEHPWIQATIVVAEEAEAGWVAELVRRRLIDDLTTVLGVAPTPVDLLVRLHSARAPRAAQLGTPRASAPPTEAATAG